MLPLSDGIPARRFPVVNVLLIVANFAVFLFYELPHLNTAVYHASFYPCSVEGACHAPLPWGLSWITAMFLHGGTAQDARVPELGASGAIAAVLGAYFVLYPASRVLTWIFPVFLVRIPAWIFLGVWFLYQLIEANFGLFNAHANGGGVAFFAPARRVHLRPAGSTDPGPGRTHRAPGAMALHGVAPTTEVRTDPVSG
jgi:membrane associated rhomboid family serine protease